VSTVSQLLDQGVKAYTRGQGAEAERCWRRVLELDPQNQRARAYLRQLLGEAASAAPAAPAQAPPPPPAAAPAGPGPAAPVEPLAADAPALAGPAYAPSPWDDGPSLSATVVLDSGGGLDLDAVEEKSDLRPLVPERRSPAPPLKSDVEVWMEGARELFALGDFSGSLEMIEKILRVDANHAEARAYLRQNESTLVAMYESKLGSLSARPRLAIHPEEVMWLNLDHRAGFLLAQIDGTVSYDDLFALSGLPRLDTARILASLVAEGVIR
jgi:tetratricopeptide (TPR) repeat protein